MVEKSSEVLQLLLDPKVQKEIARVNPGFNLTDLALSLLEAWGGMDNFAKDIYKEFETAKPGSAGRGFILKFATLVFSEVSKSQQSSPVEEMTDDEINRAIVSILPSLATLKDSPDDAGK